jgi:hypothetical protein
MVSPFLVFVCLYAFWRKKRKRKRETERERERERERDACNGKIGEKR